MGNLLRVLIIEDSEDDAILELQKIIDGGYSVDYEIVESADKMKDALAEKKWDIVISDYVMPHFNGLEALAILQKSGIDIPFVIVSGTIGEEVAVDCMKAGANDYIMKFNLKRLLPAVERELREAKNRAEQKRLELEKKQADEVLHRLNRELKAISNCNQTLLRAVDEQSLVSEICQIICNEAGYILVWVGYAENDDEKSIRPVAWAGVDSGYIASSKLSWDEKKEHGQGPAGMAIRSGNTICVKDFLTDPIMAPWRQSAIQRGYHSGFAIPLKDEDSKVLGVLLLYSSQTYTINENEMRLIEELAGDLAFGITSLRIREKRRLAEEALKEQYSTLFGIINSTNALIFSVDRQYKYTSFNSGHQAVMKALYGIEIEKGNSILDYMTVDEDRNTAKNNLDSALNGEHIIEESYSGDELLSRQYFQVSHSPIKSETGEVIGVAVLAQDITKRRRAEEALQESERKYRQIFDNTLDGIYLLEVTGTGQFSIIDVNPALEKITGIPRTKSVGKTQEEIVPEDVALAVNRKYQKCVDAGAPIEEEVKLELPSGYRYFHSILIPTRDESGRIYRIIGISRDITELKLAEEERIKLSMAVKQSPVSIVMTNCKGTIEYVNPKFTEITEFTSKEVIGKNSRVLKGVGKTIEEYKELWSTISSGKEWRGEFHNRKKNGTLFWESALISPIRNTSGEITHYVAIKEDITEKKILEEDLRKALDKSKESDRLKSSLMANMSHEFRTPMVGILGMATILKERIPDTDKQSMLDGIIVSGKRLQNTLDAVLELADLEVNFSAQKAEALNLSKITGEISADYRIKAANKGLGFISNICEEPIYIMSNSKSLSRIIFHLLDNAIKFTETGEIEILLKPEVIEGSLFAKLKVRDTGIGIEDKNKAIIFEEFRQVSEGFARSHEGSGLGLSLVKRIVNLLNGHINVESKPGVGSVFSVLLPAVKIEPDIAKPDKLEKSLKGAAVLDATTALQQVLLVEDNFLNIKVMEIYLSGVCFVDKASNGAAAIKMAEEKQYALILMDINLGPGIDGVEATNKIRQMQNYQTIPIVAVTGYSLEADKQRFLENGFTHYLSKPFDKDELIKMVSQILGIAFN